MPTLPDPNDRHRPLYHFTAPYGWLQGPSAIIYYRGRYHAFYGWDPKNVGRYLAEAHWGHAVSDDMMRWEHMPPPLSPGDGGPDRNGCWSGYVVVNDGVPTIMYSGLVKKSYDVQDRVSCLSQCLATGTEDMVTWTKHPDNPILSHPPEEFRGRLNAWHDPRPWREDDTWYLLLGSAYKDGSGGLTLLYRSDDLVDWEYLHPFCEGDRRGERWLDPDFFALGDRHMLIYSEPGGPRYMIGDYRDRRFHEESWGIVDQGPQFDGGRTLLDVDGRRIFFGWIEEDRAVDSYIDAGWACAMSLPRVLDLQDGALRMDPAPEARAPGAPDGEYADVALDAGVVRIDEARGDAVEIEAEFDLGQAEMVGLKLRRSPGGEEETVLYYDQRDRALTLDRTRSSLDPDVGRTVDSTPLALAPGEPLKLTVFVDRSILEAFGSSRACLTGRVYPTRDDSLEVELFAEGGRATVNRCRVWRRESTLS
jgi:beta-fructofuranosidase